MVDAEIFSRRLDALDDYLQRLRSLGEASEQEYLAEPGIHDLAARYLHLVVEAAIDLGNHRIAERGLRTPDSNTPRNIPSTGLAVVSSTAAASSRPNRLNATAIAPMAVTKR